jgi:hypothetical protein
MLFNTVFLMYFIACDYLSMKLYGQILYPALLGNYWISEMYFIINNNNLPGSKSNYVFYEHKQTKKDASKRLLYVGCRTV